MLIDHNPRQIVVTIKGKGLTTLDCWEKYRKQIERQVGEIMETRGIRLYQVVLVIIDASVYAHTGNAFLEIKQSDSTYWCQDEIEKVVRTTLRQVPTPFHLIEN